MKALVIPFPARRGNLHSRIVNIAMRVRRNDADTVLDYLDRWRRYAEKRGHRESLQFCDDLWQLVFNMAYGHVPPSSPPIPAPVIHFPAPVQPPAPWRQAMQAKPMRKVVAMRSILRREEGSRNPYSLVALRLDCGHKVEVIPLWEAGREPKRRRCGECGEAV